MQILYVWKGHCGLNVKILVKLRLLACMYEFVNGNEKFELSWLDVGGSMYGVYVN